ncbi:MAG: hypothetical protein J0L99_17695 [Chitinophagales bacterium]|nr:hypothetical protein [Chitinophagales bacterium]
MNTLMIDVNRQIGGCNFSLSPQTRRLLTEYFPDATPLTHVFISLDAKQEFSAFQPRIEKHILPFLTGLEIETLSQKIDNVRFMNSLDNQEIYSFALPHVQEA